MHSQWDIASTSGRKQNPMVSVILDPSDTRKVTGKDKQRARELVAWLAIATATAVVMLSPPLRRTYGGSAYALFPLFHLLPPFLP